MPVDLVVFLSIEVQDRIPVPPSEDLKLRQRVDEELQEILLDDSMEILKTAQVLEVEGSLEKRVEKGLQALDMKKAPSYLDICLVNPIGVIGSLEEFLETLFDFRSILMNPSHDRSVTCRKTSFFHHLESCKDFLSLDGLFQRALT